jgi:hypothetical protein
VSVIDTASGAIQTDRTIVIDADRIVAVVRSDEVPAASLVRIAHCEENRAA